jgi:hypothetical protein
MSGCHGPARPSPEATQAGEGTAPGGLPSAALAEIAWRPWLWAPAAVQLLRLAPNRWWQHFPPRLTPTRELWDFRMETLQGSGHGNAPDPAELREFIEWTSRMALWRRR